MTSNNPEDHEVIWIEPECGECRRHKENRMWCQDNVFENCEDCGRAPTRYVRAAGQ